MVVREMVDGETCIGHGCIHPIFKVRLKNGGIYEQKIASLSAG